MVFILLNFLSIIRDSRMPRFPLPMDALLPHVTPFLEMLGVHTPLPCEDAHSPPHLPTGRLGPEHWFQLWNELTDVPVLVDPEIPYNDDEFCVVAGVVVIRVG